VLVGTYGSPIQGNGRLLVISMTLFDTHHSRGPVVGIVNVLVFKRLSFRLQTAAPALPQGIDSSLHRQASSAAPGGNSLKDAKRRTPMR
jgi:hypothetical protein